MLYRFSRYWNRIAYFVIRMGRKMIWDQTQKNADILTQREFGSQDSKDIMCSY